MINIDEMKEFLGGDEEFIVMIVEKFVLEVGSDLKKLRAASNENNWDSVRGLSHKMLSSTKIFGIRELSERLENVESLAERRMKLEKIDGLIAEMELEWINVLEEIRHIQERLNVLLKK